MIACYNWDENRLLFNDTYGNKYDLKFKGKITIIQGESGTGKTLIYNHIKKLKELSGRFIEYAVSNIELIDKYNINSIEEFEHKLIIIDRGDLLINSEVADIINHDFGKNRYLIFARKFTGVEISPNYYGVIKKNEKELKLEYMFNVKGWN